MAGNQNIEADENQVLAAARMVREYYYPKREHDAPDWILILAIREMLQSRQNVSPQDMFEQFVKQSKTKLRSQLSRYVVQSFTAALPLAGIGAANPMEASVFNGARKFSFLKISAMAAFLAGRGKHVCRTKLNLLLFYSDFANFFSYGHSISGARYVRQWRGPMLYQYDSILTALEFAGVLRVKSAPDARIESLVSDEQTFDNLSFLELVTLHWVLMNFGDLTASEISEHSHLEGAYRYTRQDDFIVYEYARLLENLPEKMRF